MNLSRFWAPIGLGAVLCAGCTGAAGVSEQTGPVEVERKGFTIKRVEKVDLLFVVDNSNSMAGEQASLRARLPDLMRVLTEGQRAPDDPEPFTPVRDLHVGVVSVDMGIPGVEFVSGNCHADGGDDGKLQHVPRPDPATGLQCAAEYPPFLSFEAGQDSEQLAQDFACIAGLGTGGCGFESPLEAAFKAVWPKYYGDAQPGGRTMNPYRFISITEEGTWGRGDQPTAQGGNQGFVRNDPDDPSLLVVVVVTDEEDCSVSRTDHLKPDNQLPENSPFRGQDINLRCFLNKQFLYDVKDRYLSGLRKLRPGREDLVVFSVIAGVPPDLVDSQVMQSVDFSDAQSREDFYDAVLSDPRMREEIDPSTNPGSGQGNLKPSCVRAEVGSATPSTAYPPRRLVELARLFGENGMIQSICQDDFTPALDHIVNAMAKPLREMCVAQELKREADGKVMCEMYWELLPAASGASTIPVDCRELGDVLDPRQSSSLTASGGQRCPIKQLAVQNGQPSEGQGWYYDDSTPGLEHMCAGGLSRRIAFSPGVRAPAGVSVKLDCQGAS